MSSHPEKLSDIKMDTANLYREESYTDLKTGGIRKLVPVKSDGSDDMLRKPIFSGHTQLMSPHGPIPLQGVIEAASFEEAVLNFPQAMEDAMNRMIEEAQQYQREQASRIVTPADLKKESGLII